MPFHFRFDADANLALVTLEGGVEGPDLLRAAVELLAQPGWVPGMDVIWDGRALHELVLRPGELEAHARFKSEHRGAFGEGRDLLVFDRVFHKVAAELYVVLARIEGRQADVYPTARAALRSLGFQDFPEGLRPHPEEVEVNRAS